VTLHLNPQLTHLVSGTGGITGRLTSDLVGEDVLPGYVGLIDMPSTVPSASNRYLAGHLATPLGPKVRSGDPYVLSPTYVDRSARLVVDPLVFPQGSGYGQMVNRESGTTPRSPVRRLYVGDNTQVSMGQKQKNRGLLAGCLMGAKQGGAIPAIPSIVNYLGVQYYAVNAPFENFLLVRAI